MTTVERRIERLERQNRCMQVLLLAICGGCILLGQGRGAAAVEAERFVVRTVDGIRAELTEDGLRVYGPGGRHASDWPRLLLSTTDEGVQLIAPGFSVVTAADHASLWLGPAGGRTVHLSAGSTESALRFCEGDNSMPLLLSSDAGGTAGLRIGSTRGKPVVGTGFKSMSPRVTLEVTGNGPGCLSTFDEDGEVTWSAPAK
jgi:hypothetical protein